MSVRSWICCGALVLVTAVPAAAQPPSPLELVRGIREAGMPDLALEYLQEIENKPMPEDDKKAIPLERAKCQLDAAEDEPDEGTRVSMVGEAKEGFNDFLIKNPTHPRVAEASLALARLTSIEAKAQLNKARRMDVGDDDELKKQQKKESEAARPLFLLASKRFAAAAAAMKAKLADPALDPLTRQNLSREAFDADLAAAINQYHLADTFLATDAKETIERAKFLEEARDGFAKLGKGPPTSRNVWIAKAWMAETLLDKGSPIEGDAEFKAILATNTLEAEEGKRMVRFFQVRRAYLSTLTDRTPAKLQASEKELRNWLARYGNMRRPTPEVLSVRFYLAFTLQIEGEIASPTPKSGPAVLTATSRKHFDEAEKLYRVLSQSDNDYTARASRNRMFVVRKLLGEADRAAIEYPTFEAAQMAALIQMAKLRDAEDARTKAAGAVARQMEAGRALHAIGAELTRRKIEHEVDDRKFRILALLERARELATDKDSPGDVTDNLLRLVYFYQSSNQPYQAAVLGEHIARTIKSTGGKAAFAGLMALNGYTIASKKIKADLSDPTTADAAAAAADLARKGDRERAIRVARFLDEKFPNDVATDAARHRLASLLVEDRKFDQAFDVIIKVRSGYPQLTSVRQLEGYVATQLIVSQARDVPLPPGGKPAVFARAVADLNRIVKPAPTAHEEDVRGYLGVQVRLAQLYLIQSRAEGKPADATGYDTALRVADGIIGTVPTFDCLVEKGTMPRKLNVKGVEMHYQGLDVRARAIFLRGRVFVDAKKLEEAAAALEPSIEDVEKYGAMFDATMKKWVAREGDANDTEADLDEKAKVAALAKGIDQTRREIVMVGFKLRVRQGKPTEATKMLELLEKAGGSIEANQSTLELMARDLAAQIPALKKAGQPAEAKALGDGLTILLKRLGSIPNLTPTSILFLGQTLYVVEQYDDALKEFAKIPVPKIPTPPGGTEWWKIDVTKLPNGPDRKKFQDEIRDYRFAQLFTARALIGANKFPEAEKLLKDAIGVAGKEGYAYSSLDFRKETAHLHETKAATIADVKAANGEWVQALNAWSSLFGIARNRVSPLPKETTPEQEKHLKNNYFDAYFEVQRCLVQANVQLLKANPTKLAQTFADVGKKLNDMETTNKFAELEKKGTGLITPEVWSRYCDLLDKYPELKKAYTAAGGKFFLERPKE